MAAARESASRRFLMFDADLRHSITAIERRIADIRARCGVQLSRLRRDQRAKTGASVEVSTIVCRSASSGLCASERRRWQLLAIAVCLCAIGHRRSYDETSDDLLAAIDMPACKCRMDVGQMMAFNATQAWISCRDCVSASWRRIRSAGKRRFNSMAPFSAPSLVLNSALIRPSISTANPVFGSSFERGAMPKSKILRCSAMATVSLVSSTRGFIDAIDF
jgi:hypothetical protein